MSVLKEVTDLRERISKDIIGQTAILDLLLMGLLSNGNVLVEGLPGMAKTRAIKALAKNIEADYGRIQFTPDLLSTDITGKQVYYEPEKGGKGKYEFEPGAIFNNIVLADEINRAPSRVQNSLLEAMEERQVTVGGITRKMPDLFLVMATQNPDTQGGTFPLPEAQKDRFLMHVNVDYLKEEAELDVVRLIRKEESQAQKAKEKKIEAAGGKDPDQILTPQKVIFDARAEIDKIIVPEEVERYIVDLIFATRYPQRYTYELKSFIRTGASPRASIALDRVCRTRAWMEGRKETSIDDAKIMSTSILRHRLARGDRAIEHKVTTDDIVEEIIELIDTLGPQTEIKK